MSSSKLSTRFIIFVVSSLVTHLLELAASGWFCYTLIEQTDLRMPWFSVAAGLFILPMVAVHLASAVLLLKRKAETYITCQVVTTAILHVLQLGFISRHFIILKEAPMTSKRTEIIEMMLLRISFAILSGSTLLVMQINLLFYGFHQQSWAIYISGSIILVSVTWAVSTFRRCLAQPDFGDLLIAWPGTALRIFWRAGEILARIIAIGLFSSLYIRFLILVISLHWLSMLVCLYIPLITSMEWSTTSCTKRTLICLMISFTHVFVFINTSSENVVFRYTFYYVIFCLENATLIAVWFIQSSPEQFSQNSVFAYIGVVSFIASLIAMIIYYKFFHTATCENSSSSVHKVSNCRSTFLRHGTTENWQRQTMSNSDLSSTVTSSFSHVKCEQKLYAVEDHLRECEIHHTSKARDDGLDVCSLTLNMSSSIDEAHKKSNNTNDECPDSDMKNSSDQAMYLRSNKRPVWLPSGDSNFANQLLKCNLENFDTTETADSESSSAATDFDDCYKRCSSTRNFVSSPEEFQKTVTKVGSSKAVTFEPNSCPDGCNTDPRYTTPRITLSTPVCTNICDSENGYKTCCDGSHGVSDMPSEHSVAVISESNLRIKEGKIPYYPYIGSHHRHHHHLQRNSCIHNNTDTSATTEDPSSLLQKEPQEDLESVHQNKSPMVDGSRNISMSSMVLCPSIDRKKTRRHSPAQKVQPATRVDNLTTIPTSTDEHSINLREHHVLSGYRDTDHVLAQSEKLARQLLKASNQTEKNISNKKSNSAIVSTSDPRFTLRVMTSPVEENSISTDLISEAMTSKTKTECSNERMSTIMIDDSRKSKHIDDCKRKDHFNIYDIKEVAITDSGNDIYLRKSSRVHGRLVEHTNNHISSSGYPDEVVYENLWPIKQEKQKRRIKDRMASKFVGDSLTSRSDRPGVYACSESEDSALPHEVLSSSAEGFTVSESDSDVSLEFVI